MSWLVWGNISKVMLKDWSMVHWLIMRCIVSSIVIMWVNSVTMAVFVIAKGSGVHWKIVWVHSITMAIFVI